LLLRLCFFGAETCLQEVLKTRLAVTPEAFAGRGLIGSFLQIAREGPAMLYKGLFPSLLGVVPYAGFFLLLLKVFAAYGFLRSRLESLLYDAIKVRKVFFFFFFLLSWSSSSLKKVHGVEPSKGASSAGCAVDGSDELFLWAVRGISASTCQNANSTRKGQRHFASVAIRNQRRRRQVSLARLWSKRSEGAPCCLNLICGFRICDQDDKMKRS
jgi:hypothetical protein